METRVTERSQLFTHTHVTDAFCKGTSIVVDDKTAVARAIALVLVQEYTLARQLLSGKSIESPTVEPGEVEEIISSRLHLPVVYHRDGFLFQLIVWLATYMKLGPDDYASLPHIQATQKGQDAVIVHMSEDAISALSICEDKATTNPRRTIRTEVWPDIRDYEKGRRVDELRSAIITTLGLSGIPQEDSRELIRRISWQDSRRYRVRITVQKNRTSRLFKGFPDRVTGDLERRRGETVEIPNLRVWMEDLSTSVERELRLLAS